MTALADKKERDETEPRERNRRISSSSADGCDPIIQMNVSVETPKSKRIRNAYPTYQIKSEGIVDAIRGQQLSTRYECSEPGIRWKI